MDALIVLLVLALSFTELYRRRCAYPNKSGVWVRVLGYFVLALFLIFGVYHLLK